MHVLRNELMFPAGCICLANGHELDETTSIGEICLKQPEMIFGCLHAGLCNRAVVVDIKLRWAGERLVDVV